MREINPFNYAGDLFFILLLIIIAQPKKDPNFHYHVIDGIV